MIPDFLNDLGMTQTAYADAIGVSRVRLNELIHGRRALTPNTALRLERTLGKPAYWWLGLQQDYDLWQALHDPEIEKIRALRRLRRLASGATP
jgi:addiction module HigA family antidote